MIALVIALPNFIWQCTHHFIALDFLRHIHERDIRIGRTAGFVIDQFFETTNVVTVPLWMLGLLVLLLAPQDRRDRVLAFMALVPFLLFLVAHGRGYYMGPIYPMLFAVGAVVLERVLSTSRAVLEKNCLRNGCFAVTRRKRCYFRNSASRYARFAVVSIRHQAER